MTLGAEGMILGMSTGSGGVRTLAIPSIATDVFDVTGAGDVVISSVVGLIGSGFTLEEACQDQPTLHLKL